MADRVNSGGRLTRLWQWAKGQLVQDVPGDIAVCEFDCRKLQCTMGEWETCERRLEKAAQQAKIKPPRPASR